MAKQNKNLSLDPEVIRRAERYSARHDTNVSQLVSNFLEKLPDANVETAELAPAVRRLLGIVRGKSGVKQYHQHLEKRYAR